MENPLQPISTQATTINSNPLLTPTSKKKLPVKLFLVVTVVGILGVGIAAVLYLTTQKQDVRQQASGGTCTSVGECLNGHVCVIGPNDTVTPTGASCAATEQIAVSSAPAATIADVTSTPAIKVTPNPSATPIVQVADKGIVGGTFCSSSAKFPGTLFTYNVTSKQIRVATVTENRFLLSLPVGPTMFLYQPFNSQLNVGYSDASHKLKSVILSSATPITNLQLCDTQVDQTSIPNTYAMVQ